MWNAKSTVVYSSIHGNYVSKKTFSTIFEIVGTALKAMAKCPWLTTDAGEQADDDNSEPELDELVGSEHLQSSRVSARIFVQVLLMHVCICLLFTQITGNA